MDRKAQSVLIDIVQPVSRRVEKKVDDSFSLQDTTLNIDIIDATSYSHYFSYSNAVTPESKKERSKMILLKKYLLVVFVLSIISTCYFFYSLN